MEIQGKLWPKVRKARLALVAALGSAVVGVLYKSGRKAIAVSQRERDLIREHQRKLAHFEELAAGLAHEVRNPLTSISALVFSIQRKLPVDSSEHRDLETIGKEIHRVNQILKDFTQLSRPAAPHIAPLDVGGLLEEECALLRPELERMSIKLECDRGTGEQVEADRQQMKQVLLNLVKNAAESIGREGLVRVRVRRDCRHFQSESPEKVLIEVEDTGTGLSSEARKRIFEPFFSTKPEGTGLGLAVSQRIIDRHGGRLSFESEPGHGTLFRIELPAYERQ